MELSAPFAPLIGFQSRKAAQISAYFAIENGGKIEKLKLIKLLYLSERAMLARYERPMLYDEYYSLKDGPICSSALNGINGVIDESTWAKYVARGGNIVIPVRALTRADLDEVSNAEMSVLLSVWEEFGTMTPAAIRRYTHEHCSEYQEVKGGRVPISAKEVLKAVGCENADDAADEIASFRKLESLFSA